MHASCPFILLDVGPVAGPVAVGLQDLAGSGIDDPVIAVIQILQDEFLGIAAAFCSEPDVGSVVHGSGFHVQDLVASRSLNIVGAVVQRT